MTKLSILSLRYSHCQHFCGSSKLCTNSRNSSMKCQAEKCFKFKLIFLIVLLSLSWKLTNMISVLRLGKNHVAEKEQFQFIFRKKYFYYILLHCLPNWTTRSNWLFLWGCTELLDFGLHKIFIFQKCVQLAMNKGNVQT